jgi:hypothetical protein
VRVKQEVEKALTAPVKERGYELKPEDVARKAKIGTNHKNPVRIQISTPATEDKKEGTAAFLQKRAPQFQGR